MCFCRACDSLLWLSSFVQTSSTADAAIVEMIETHLLLLRALLARRLIAVSPEELVV